MAFLARAAFKGAARGLKGDAGDFASIERAEEINKIKKVLEDIKLRKMSLSDLDNNLLNKLGGEEGVKKYLKESKSLDVARSNLNPENNVKRDTVETNSLKSSNGTLDVSKSTYYSKEEIVKEQKKNVGSGINKEFEEGSEKNLKNLDQNLGQVENDFEGELGKAFRKKERNLESNGDGLENGAEQKIDNLGKEGSKIDGEDGSSLESKFFHIKSKHPAKTHDKFRNNDINKINDNQILTDSSGNIMLNNLMGKYNNTGIQRLQRAHQNVRQASSQGGSFSQTYTGGQNLATGGGPKSGSSRSTGNYDPVRGQKSESWIKNAFDPFRKGYDNTAALRDGLSSINDQAKQVNGPIDFLMEFAMRKARESGVDVPDEGIANNNANNNNNNSMSSIDDMLMKKTENRNNKALESNSGRSGLEYRGNSKTSMGEHNLAGKTAMVEHHPERKMSLGEHNLAGKTAMVEHQLERKAEIQEHQPKKKADIEQNRIEKKADIEQNRLERKAEIGERQLERKAEIQEHRLEGKAEIQEHQLGRKASIEESLIEAKAEIEQNLIEAKAEIEQNFIGRRAEIEQNLIGRKADIEQNLIERKAEIEQNLIERRASTEQNLIERKTEIAHNRIGMKAEIEQNHIEGKAETEQNQLEKKSETEQNQLERKSEIERNQLERKAEIRGQQLEKKAKIEEYNPELPKVEDKEHTTYTEMLENSKQEDTLQRNATFSDQTSHSPLKEGDAAQQREESDNVQKDIGINNIEKAKLEFIESFGIGRLPNDVRETATNLAKNAYKDAQKRNIDINKLKDEIQKQLDNESFRDNFINVLRQERAMIESERKQDNSGKAKYKEQEIF